MRSNDLFALQETPTPLPDGTRCIRHCIHHMPPVQPSSRVPRPAVRAGIVHVKFKPPFLAVYKTARLRGSLGLSNRHFGTDWWRACPKPKESDFAHAGGTLHSQDFTRHEVGQQADSSAQGD